MRDALTDEIRADTETMQTRPARWAVLDRNFTVQPVDRSADAGEA